MKFTKSILLASFLLGAFSLTASAATPSPLKPAEIAKIKKNYPTLIGSQNISVVKAYNQGEFKQLQLEVSTPRGPQKFDVFLVKGIKTVFAGNAYKPSGEKFELPLNSAPVKAGVAITVGSGKETLYLVTDPECPYCQRLEEAIDPVLAAKYTINVIPMPLSFHEKAKPMMYWVFAGKDNAEQADRLHKVMTGDKAWETYVPTDAEKEAGEVKFAKANAAAMELGANGTPSMFDASFKRFDPSAIVKK